MFIHEEGKEKVLTVVKAVKKELLKMNLFSIFLKGMYLKVKDSKDLLSILKKVIGTEISFIFRKDKD